MAVLATAAPTEGKRRLTIEPRGFRLGALGCGCASLSLLLLPLIGLLFLAGWGLILLVTAHAPRPINATGVVAEAVDIFKGDNYEHTRLALQGDARSYYVYLPGLNPSVPRGRPSTGERVTLWFDPETNWGDLSQTLVLALSLDEEGPYRPAHTNDDFVRPESAANRQRLVGAGLLGLVALILGLAAVWERFTDRHSSNGPLPITTRT